MKHISIFILAFFISGFSLNAQTSTADSVSKDPLVIYDGRIISYEKMNTINPDSIQSVNVLKGDSAKAMYGEQGANGVIIINSKKNAQYKEVTVATDNDTDSSVDYDKVFLKVESEAEFPGGKSAWSNYLSKHLNTNVPVKNHAPPGKYEVIIRFRVNTDGSVSDVVAKTAYGYGMEEEVMRVIRKSPKWKPATKN